MPGEQIDRFVIGSFKLSIYFIECRQKDFGSPDRVKPHILHSFGCGVVIVDGQAATLIDDLHEAVVFSTHVLLFHAKSVWAKSSPL